MTCCTPGCSLLSAELASEVASMTRLLETREREIASLRHVIDDQKRSLSSGRVDVAAAAANDTDADNEDDAVDDTAQRQPVICVSTCSEKDVCDEGSDAIHHSDGKTLAETVSHDRDLTSRLELEIQSLQKTVRQLREELHCVTRLNSSLEQRSLSPSPAHSSMPSPAAAGDVGTKRVENQLKIQQLESDALRMRLIDAESSSDRRRRTLEHEVEQLSVKLSERDDAISRLRQQSTDAVSQLEKTHMTELLAVKDLRDELQQQINESREQISELREQLRQKNVQIETFSKVNEDLEREVRTSAELTMELKRSEMRRLDAEHEVTRLSAALDRQVFHSQQIQATMERQEMASRSEKSQLDSECSELRRQIRDLKETVVKDSQIWENDRTSLCRQLELVLCDNATSLSDERPCSDVMVANDALQLQQQLLREVVSRKTAEHRANCLHRLLTELRNRKFGFESSLSELRLRLAGVESELSVEKAKCLTLRKELLRTDDGRSRAADDDDDDERHHHVQLAQLQGEVKGLRSQLEAARHESVDRLNSLNNEITRQQEVLDRECAELVQESQVARHKVDELRREIVDKDDATARLHGDVSAANQAVQQLEKQCSRTQNQLDSELETKEQLQRRNKELELMLIKLQAQIETDAGAEATRAEVSNKIHELRHRMEEQMNSRRQLEAQLHNKETQKMEEFRSKMLVLEAALEQEQAMHGVTKAQLAALRDDNQRLRHQLHAIRRHAVVNAEPATNKSRLEEINEIIARSQVRAQQLLAAGSLHSEVVVTTTTTTSSAPLVSVAGQQPTLGDPACTGCQTSTAVYRDNDLCLVTRGDNAAATASSS